LKRIHITLLTLILSVLTLHAHHFKGLPHYNYFENYPQTPEEEFLGQSGNYEFSLVVYDFQGINKEDAETPDNVRLFLVAFDLRSGKLYNGAMTMEIRDDDEVIHTEKLDSAELENLYSLHRNLPETGDYSLHLTLHDVDNLPCVIPFQLSSQKVHWGRWIAVSLTALLLVAAVGARKARVRIDRKEQADRNMS
jgi:hypothetical protein